MLTNYQKAILKRKDEETAQKMLGEGIDVLTITRVAGLTEDEIKAIANRPAKQAA